MATKKIKEVVNEAEVAQPIEDRVAVLERDLRTLIQQVNAIDLHAFFSALAIANAKKAKAPEITDETIEQAKTLIEEFRKKSLVYGESKQK